MNKKYISLAILTILAVVLGVYKHMEGLSQTAPQTEGSDVLGIKDDLKISNEIVNFTEEGNDVIKITYKYVISHSGNYVAKNIIARNWFTDTPENTYEVLSITSDSHLNINKAFNGKNDTSMIVGDNTMPAMSNAVVFVSIKLNYKERALKFISYVDVSGKSEHETSTSSSAGSATVSSSKTATSSAPTTPKPSTSTTPKPSSTSTSAPQEPIDYGFTGLLATAGSKPVANITIGYNHGIRLAWSKVNANCIRKSSTSNSQWTGNSGTAQGYKDIMSIKQDTTFILDCNGTVYSVFVKVNPPKPSSSATTPPANTSSSSDPVTTPTSQTSSAGNVDTGEILGLYDAAQVTFSLPRQGSVAGAVTIEPGGKDQ